MHEKSPVISLTDFTGNNLDALSPDHNNYKDFYWIGALF